MDNRGFCVEKHGDAILGAGKFVEKAYNYYTSIGEKVSFFIDNDEKKWGKFYVDTPVLSLEKLLAQSGEYKIVVAVAENRRKEITMQLQQKGCDYEIFDIRDRLISYSDPNQLEDVILYHILKNEKEIFYIDEGQKNFILEN